MGVFIYKGPWDNDNGNPAHNEITIEFLKGGVQFNYYHNNVGGHEIFLSAKDLGFDPRDDFHVYGFVWEPTQIKFLIDGVVKYVATQDIPQAEEGGMWIIINLWKCLEEKRCGPAPQKVNATGYLDWVEYTELKRTLQH